MRRRKPKSDNRLKWYDDLQIYFSGRWYSSEEYKALCARTMICFSRAEPHWKNDPTYDLKRKK